MKMPKTWGVQPILLPVDSVFACLKPMEDIFSYLNAELCMDGEFAFMARNSVEDLGPTDGDEKIRQYWTNGILISGLLEHLDEFEYSQAEEQFEGLIKSVCSLLSLKLRAFGIDTTHEVIVDRDEKYGDIVISFWKRGGGLSE